MRFSALFLACSTLVAVAVDAAAQSPQIAAATADGEIRDIVEGAARNDAGWRQQADEFIRGEHTPTFGNRTHARDRAIRLLEAIDERCRNGECQTGRQTLGAASVAQSPSHDVARMARTNVCSAYPIAATGVKRWNVPAGSLAFDFQPRGTQPSAGAIPIVPGDGRLMGGSRGERYADGYVLTGDSLHEVRGFKTPVPPGRLRVILLGSTQQRALAMRLPFGASLEVNGRVLEVLGVAPNRWLQRGVLSGSDRAEATAAANLLPGSAPAIVFETDSARGQLTLGFPAGIEVGAVIVEPADQPSSFVLDAAAPGAVASDSICLQEQERIDRALAGLPSGRVTQTRTPTGEVTPKPSSPTSLSPS
ncbi:MAG: hypothetical protein KF889_08735 [Alphaproteobacteria bacterium]|nr:hypothetical protein [Alphaproteobacteria bacterium]MCW5740907.1 hypothetical protein [Alphaproteobacteria bacterium]